MSRPSRGASSGGSKRRPCFPSDRAMLRKGPTHVSCSWQKGAQQRARLGQDTETPPQRQPRDLCIRACSDSAPGVRAGAGQAAQCRSAPGRDICRVAEVQGPQAPRPEERTEGRRGEVASPRWPAAEHHAGTDGREPAPPRGSPGLLSIYYVPGAAPGAGLQQTHGGLCPLGLCFTCEVTEEINEK